MEAPKAMSIQEARLHPFWRLLSPHQKAFLEAIAVHHGDEREALLKAYKCKSTSVDSMLRNLKRNFNVSFLLDALMGRTDATRTEIKWHIVRLLRTVKNEKLKVEMIRLYVALEGMVPKDLPPAPPQVQANGADKLQGLEEFKL